MVDYWYVSMDMYIPKTSLSSGIVIETKRSVYGNQNLSYAINI